MPEKMAKSARRATFGLPKVPVAVCTSLGLAGRPEKREYPRQIGSHPGNPGVNGCIRVAGLLGMMRGSNANRRNPTLVATRIPPGGNLPFYGK